MSISATHKPDSPAATPALLGLKSDSSPYNRDDAEPCPYKTYDATDAARAHVIFLFVRDILDSGVFSESFAPPRRCPMNCCDVFTKPVDLIRHLLTCTAIFQAELNCWKCQGCHKFPTNKDESAPELAHKAALIPAMDEDVDWDPLALPSPLLHPEAPDELSSRHGIEYPSVRNIDSELWQSGDSSAWGVDYNRLMDDKPQRTGFTPPLLYCDPFVPEASFSSWVDLPSLHLQRAQMSPCSGLDDWKATAFQPFLPSPPDSVVMDTLSQSQFLPSTVTRQQSQQYCHLSLETMPVDTEPLTNAGRPLWLISDMRAACLGHNPRFAVSDNLSRSACDKRMPASPFSLIHSSTCSPTRLHAAESLADSSATLSTYPACRTRSIRPIETRLRPDGSNHATGTIPADSGSSPGRPLGDLTVAEEEVGDDKGRTHTDLLICRVCGFKPAGIQRHRKGRLRRHERIHSGVLHACDECPRQFNRIDNLRKHKKDTHRIKGVAIISSECPLEKSGSEEPRTTGYM